MDPLETLKPETDSSLVLIAESIDRGYATYIFEPKDLFYASGKVLAKIKRFYKDKVLDYETHDLSEFKMIFIRQNPPFNMHYITTTYLLEKISHQVTIINNPSSIRDNPEKLFCLDFEKYVPKTCITEDFMVAMDFVGKFERAVIKPLYACGGNDVSLVNKQNLKETFYSLIKKYEDKIIIQEFIPDVKHGDKRVLLVNGNPIATVLRKPQEGSFIANLTQGGTAERTNLNSKELELCNQVGARLKQKNIVFAGLDLIGGYLTEINITSPTMIISANNFYDMKIEKLIFDELENNS
jgi:glutathione synthase